MTQEQSSDLRPAAGKRCCNGAPPESLSIASSNHPDAEAEPEASSRRADIGRVIAAIPASGRRAGRITTEELLSARHEGHRA